MTHPLILHNYVISPFSEKVRAALGMLGASWQSAIIPETPPRHKLEPMIGGYGRTPVAQVGADLYCDSKIIFHWLAQHYNTPTLDVFTRSQEEQEYLTYMERDFLFASVMGAMGWPLVKKSMRNMAPQSRFTILFDRIKMGKAANIPMPDSKQAKVILAKDIPALESRLTDTFLFGPEPSYGDFALYQSLWMIKEVGERKHLDNYPNILAWFERIQQFGNGTSTVISPDQALQTALTSVPADIPDTMQNDPMIGNQVSIAPTDYRLEPSTGILRGVSDVEWIIERNSAPSGLVHVHFPRQGFELKTE